MRGKIVGISHNSGEYEGKPFDSVKVFAVCDARGLIAGEGTCAASCKTENIPLVFGRDFQNPDDLTVLLGETCVMCVNKYNQITDCVVVR